MPNRRLTKDEAAKADALLAEVKAMVTDAAGDDPVLLFALRRRLFKSRRFSRMRLVNLTTIGCTAAPREQL